MEKIISLYYESELKIEFWRLRQRAELDGMKQTEIMFLLGQMAQKGEIEFHANGEVELKPCTCAMECLEENHCRHLPKYHTA